MVISWFCCRLKASRKCACEGSGQWGHAPRVVISAQSCEDHGGPFLFAWPSCVVWATTLPLPDLFFRDGLKDPRPAKNSDRQNTRMTSALRHLAARLAAAAITIFARVMTSPRIVFTAPLSKDRQTVYFANHTSNGDGVLIWISLPQALRRKTRPVAAADYWLKTPLRAFIGRDVFNVLSIERVAEGRNVDPITLMAAAVDEGASLIIFPEGRRNEGADKLLSLKPGIFHLAKKRPQIELVPVWINNLSGVMPRGEVIPVPLICTLTFGAPLTLFPVETKDEFMARARTALLDLSPQGDVV